jgi:hypothetical protein
MAKGVVDEVMKHLITCFINQQDSFKSLSIFRWLSTLVDRRVICSKTACDFILSLLEELSKVPKFQKDLTLHCILTFLTTESTSQRLQKEQSIDFGSILESLKSKMKDSQDRAACR